MSISISNRTDNCSFYYNIYTRKSNTSLILYDTRNFNPLRRRHKSNIVSVKGNRFT